MNDAPVWSIRTFGNEDWLPRVPLPTLADTAERFIEWCSPLLTPRQLAETRSALAEFCADDGPGPRLHAALERYDNASKGVRSWLDTFWHQRYLGRRDRIALNANFFFLFQDEPGQTQLGRAAGLIAAALEYKRLLDQELIPPIVLHGHALSMEQNKFLFSETRIPGRIQDTVRVPYTDAWPGPSRERHIVVFCRGNMFRMDVIGADGFPYTLDDFESGLRAVMKAGNEQAAPGTAVGHFTTKARTEWADSREALIARDPANAVALDEIETALFCVCLEDIIPADQLQACDQLLHGNSGNRWFDKAVSFIVFADGRAGMNGEHCGLDGTTVLAFIDRLLTTPATERSRRSGDRSQAASRVSAIEFVLDEPLRADVAAAAVAFSHFAAGTASAAVTFSDFSTERAKAFRVSPDAFVQMAFQLAHQRATGFVGATYESIATRQYQSGRTEAMRVVTPEVLRFVATMDDPGATTADMVAAFHAAADKHVRRAKECQAGRAPEQHLWELLMIQGRYGPAIGVDTPPRLFDSPGWTVMRDDYLSTSSVPSVNIQFAGFGSTGSHCIGVAYVLLPERCNLYISAPRAFEAEMHAFADHLRMVVRELQDLLRTSSATG